MAVTINSSGVGPTSSAFVITPDDNNDLAYVTRGIYVGTAGNLAAILYDDASSISFVSVQAGSIYPFRLIRVLSTGTTAGNLV